MNQIIDVDYEVVDSIENKSVEELAAEANKFYAQAEAVANVALMYMAQAGARLELIKEKLPHGEFEDWCKNNLSFSKSKAEKMMKLSQKLSDENSIFSKTETFTDIGISKVWALLSAPEDVAEKVLENSEAADMTAREFKDEIKRLKEEKQRLEEEKETLQSELKNEKQFREELYDDIDSINEKLSGANARIAQLEAEPLVDESTAKENEELTARVEMLKALKDEATSECDKLNNKLTKEKEKSKALKKRIDEEIEKAVEKGKADAKEEALMEARKESEDLQKAYEESQRNIEKLEKQLQQSNNEALISFKLKCTQLQIDFNAALETVDEVKAQDPEQGKKMMSALGKVVDMMKGQVE
ncbi:MAG: DUF3102 domain-containing protein [Emergencia sp.]